MKKWFFIIFIILLIGIPTLVRISRATEKQEIEDKGVPVAVTIATKEDIVKIMNFSSRVEGIEQAPVYPDLPGDFLKFLVQDGQYVRKDQSIAYIEQDIPGVEREPISVKSPLSGIISINPVDRGQLVRPQDPMVQSDPLAQVARIEKIKVKFRVPEKYHLKENLPIKVEIPSLSKTYDGVIEEATSFYDPQTRTQSVVGIIENPNREILPGMFAKVWVEVARVENAVAVPIDAVIGIVDKYIFKVDKGRAIQVAVETGLANDINIVVESGVENGDTIIVEGQLIVKDSSKVEIKEKK